MGGRVCSVQYRFSEVVMKWYALGGEGIGSRKVRFAMVQADSGWWQWKRAEMSKVARGMERKGVCSWAAWCEFDLRLLLVVRCWAKFLVSLLQFPHL